MRGRNKIYNMKFIKNTILLLFFINITIFAKVINVGVVLDNNSQQTDKMLENLTIELNRNFAGTNFQPKITEKVYLNGSNVESELDKLNSNPKLDSIFILTSQPVERISNMKQNKFYTLPFGFSEKRENFPKNVNYIYSKLNLNEFLSPFKGIKDVKEVDVLISNMSAENIALLQNKTKIEGLKVNVLKATAENIINSNNRKVPTFLIDFDNRLKAYSYSGLNLDKEIIKRLRAASLNYMFYKTGKGMGKIVEINEPRKEIYFNQNVASQINLHPNLIFIQEISELNVREDDFPRLSLKEAVDRALDSNLDLLQVKQNVSTNFYGTKVVNSKRLPQLSANMNYNALDDRSPTFLQGAPTNSVSSYLQLSQVIFNDQLNASVYIEKLALDSSRNQYEQQKLNTIYYVSSTYIYILQLKAQLDIQMSNYKLLKETLDVAKINYNVGAGGLQDVYRLESDVNASLSNIASVRGEIRTQELALNTLLNLPESNTYMYQNLDQIAPYFLFSKNLDQNYSFGSERIKKIKAFLVKGALENSNQLQQIDNSIKGKERQKKAVNREKYLPTIQAVGTYNKNNIITPWGKQSSGKFPDEYWQAGIAVSLPLIKGGEIYYNNEKIKSEIKALEYNKTSAENKLAEQVLQTYTQLLTNYVQSYTSKTSAEIAKKNLNIVKNLYAEGNITVTDFLSAQNNALTQELSHVIDSFNLINSTLKLENLYGKSSFTINESERMRLLDLLQKELEN